MTAESQGPILLRLLGPVELDGDDGHARTILTQPKRFAVLAYLALAAPGAYVRRDRMLAIFWPESDQERARAGLRDALYTLRRTLGPELIQTRGADDVRLDPDRLSVDAHEFRAAVSRRDHAAAVRLYRGDLLSSFHVSGVPAFDDWLDAERTKLRGLAIKVLTAVAADALDSGDNAEAAIYYRRALSASPYDETLLFGLMEAMELEGHGVPALSEADRFVLRTSEALNLEPTNTLRRKVQLLRSRLATLSTSESATPNSETVMQALETYDASPVPARATGPRRNRFWRRALPVAALLIILAAIAARFGLHTNSPSKDTVAQIVITPFSVRGSDRIAYLREGMVDLLVAKLDGAPGLRVVDPKAMLENLPRRSTSSDLEVARVLARRFGAQHFITGTVVQGGEALQITATLYDAGGAVLARSDRVAASEADLFPAIDDLARELVAGLLTGPSTQLGSLAALTTSSYPAVQQYLRGEQLFRAGEYENAVTAFQDAVAKDSTFGLAYYRLSSAADWAGKAEIAEASAQAAMRHRDRLPRAASDLVTARWEYWFGDARRANEIYGELTTARPTDVEAWFERGEVLFHAGPWMGRSMRDSEASFRRVIALDPSHIGALMHLARVAALNRNVPLLDSLLGHATRIDPAHDRTVEIRALRASASRNAAGIDSVISRLTFHRDGYKIVSDAERVAVYSGDLPTAERLARIATSAGRPRGERTIALQTLIHVCAGQGKWAEAKRQITMLAALDPVIAAQVFANLVTMPFLGATAEDIRDAQRALLEHPPAASPKTTAAADPQHFARARRTYQLGLLAIAARDSNALRFANQLAADTAATNLGVFQQSLAGSLRAHLLAQKGDSAGALRELQRTWLPPRKPLMIGWAWTHSNVTDRLFLATLLARAGQKDDARRWLDAAYEDIAGTPVLLNEVERVRQRPAGGR
ncbi:MAG: BTAD domain-containing putative transcriptional regulator [Longimicrobiales bacterium]